MIVCVCHRVSDRDIAREVQAGRRSFAELQQALRVATGCGACRECAQALFDEQRRALTATPHPARPPAPWQPVPQAA